VCFRLVAVIEAVSYLLLVCASLAHRLGNADNFVPRIGPVHGVIFLVYLSLALVLSRALRWGTRSTLVVVLAAVVPFGAIFVEQRVGSSQRTGLSVSLSPKK
jgi:integral membrane protein